MRHELRIVTTRDMKVLAGSVLSLAEKAYWSIWNGQKRGGRLDLERVRQEALHLVDLCDMLLDDDQE